MCLKRIQPGVSFFPRSSLSCFDTVRPDKTTNKRAKQKLSWVVVAALSRTDPDHELIHLYDVPRRARGLLRCPYGARTGVGRCSRRKAEPSRSGVVSVERLPAFACSQATPGRPPPGASSTVGRSALEPGQHAIDGEPRLSLGQCVHD